jgi:Flp pilus assembly protein TadD
MCYDEIGDKKNAYLALKKAVELNPKYKESIKFN